MKKTKQTRKATKVSQLTLLPFNISGGRRSCCGVHNARMENTSTPRFSHTTTTTTATSKSKPTSRKRVKPNLRRVSLPLTDPKRCIQVAVNLYMTIHYPLMYIRHQILLKLTKSKAFDRTRHKNENGTGLCFLFLHLWLDLKLMKRFRPGQKGSASVPIKSLTQFSTAINPKGHRWQMARR